MTKKHQPARQQPAKFRPAKKVEAIGNLVFFLKYI